MFSHNARHPIEIGLNYIDIGLYNSDIGRWLRIKDNCRMSMSGLESDGNTMTQRGREPLTAERFTYGVDEEVALANAEELKDCALTREKRKSSWKKTNIRRYMLIGRK